MIDQHLQLHFRRVAFIVACAFVSCDLYAVADGYVVKADSSAVYLDWGSSSGLHVGDRFTIYRSGAVLKHPVTGEVLGHVEDQRAAGRLDRIEEKFSLGTLDSGAGTAQAGDRTRVVSTAVTASTSTGSGGELVPGVKALTEVWRSQALSGAVTGVTRADLLGDGHTELVVSYKDKIEAFKIVDHQLTSLGVYQHRLYRHWLGVEAGDPAHQGHDDIFANAWFDSANRPHVVVLKWDAGKFKAVGDLDGFARSVDRMTGHSTIVWQTLSRNREKHFSAPCEFIFDHGVYKPGPSLGLSTLRDDQLLGFTLGDWDGDHKEDLAVLEGGDRLKVTLSTGVWTAPDAQGGTKNEFVADNDVSLSFTPRLLSWHPASGSDELIAPHNISELAIRIFQMKFFKKSELTAWSWNGQDMTIDWQQSVPGYMADAAIGNFLPESSNQLLVAVNAANDKTVLLAYRLP